MLIGKLTPLSKQRQVFIFSIIASITNTRRPSGAGLIVHALQLKIFQTTHLIEHPKSSFE